MTPTPGSNESKLQENDGSSDSVTSTIEQLFPAVSDSPEDQEVASPVFSPVTPVKGIPLGQLKRLRFPPSGKSVSRKALNFVPPSDEDTATTSRRSAAQILDAFLTESENSDTAPTISRRRTDRSKKYPEPAPPPRTNSHLSSNDKVLMEDSIQVGRMTPSKTESLMESKDHGGSTDSIVSTVEQLVTAVTDSLEEEKEIATPCYSPILYRKNTRVNFSPMNKKKRLIPYNSAGDASTNRQLLAFDFVETEDGKSSQNFK